MAEIDDLSITAAANDGRWSPSMAVSAVEDAGQALEALLARFFKDYSGQINSSGTGSAYQITPFRAVTTHKAGNAYLWKAHVANTGAATIQIGAIAAKPLRRQGGGSLTAGDIATNQLMLTVYNASGDYYEAIGIRGGAVSNHLGTYTVATLPTGSAGQTAYASDGRKNGETSGNGTGVFVFRDGTAWRACDTGATVAA